MDGGKHVCSDFYRPSDENMTRGEVTRASVKRNITKRGRVLHDFEREEEKEAPLIAEIQGVDLR